jgi:transposase
MDENAEAVSYLRAELSRLIADRDELVDHIDSLFRSQGIYDYGPLRSDRRQRLEEVQTGEGQPLPQNLKAEIGRAFTRLELLLDIIEECRRDLNSALGNQCK